MDDPSRVLGCSFRAQPSPGAIRQPYMSTPSAPGQFFRGATMIWVIGVAVLLFILNYMDTHYAIGKRMPKDSNGDQWR